MKSIDAQLWDYIDGNCHAAERAAINNLIMTDEACRLKYQELLQLNSEFAAMELDEPPMSFIYNVIEVIRTEQAQIPLRAAVINKRLIFTVALFFVAVISILLIFAASTINIIGIATAAPRNFTVPDVMQYISKPLIRGFIFFDMVIGLFFFDGYLRRNRTPRFP